MDRWTERLSSGARVSLTAAPGPGPSEAVFFLSWLLRREIGKLIAGSECPKM